MTVSQTRDSPPTWRARFLYFYPPGTGWTNYTPRHWIPFSSPPTTRRAKVELFDLASTHTPRSKSKSKSKSHCDWRSVSKSWYRAPSGAHDQIFLSDSYVLVSVGRPLWREDGAVFCMCRWPVPAQSFAGPSPLCRATVCSCLSVAPSPFVASYDSQGHGGGIRPRLHTGYTPRWYA
jgi:hypothetical protein